MTRQLIFGAVLAAGLAAGTAAQQAAPSTAQTDRTGQSVTLTGCVQPADRTSAATAGTSGGDTTSRQSSQRGPFILTNASVTSSGSAGTSGTGTATGGTGTTGTGASASTGSATRGAGQTTYRIAGGDDQNLHQYVNSRVEITGTLEDAASRGTATGTSGTGTGAGGTGTAAASGTATIPAVRVTSVRRISESCAG
jgi:hypothetical protein